MPKRNDVPVTVFYFVFYDIGIFHSLNLLLSFIRSAYPEGNPVNLKISLVRRKYRIVYFHLGQEKRFPDIPDFRNVVRKGVCQIRVVHVGLFHFPQLADTFGFFP